jgi:hypothetical protein
VPCDRSFARVAAIAAIVSAPLAAGNLAAMLATVHFDISGMTNPLVLLHAGRAAAPLWRWSMVLDIFGYYLLIVPLVLLLRTSLRYRSRGWPDLFSFCLLGYCLIGAIGGALLATALPTLIRQYAAIPAHRVALQTVFTGYTDGIYRGLWNLLEELLAGVGWVGFGVALRLRHRRLGLVSIILGTACLVDSAGTALSIDAIASVGLTAYLVLAPVWACWLGAGLLRASAAGTPAAKPWPTERGDPREEAATHAAANRGEGQPA